MNKIRTHVLKFLAKDDNKTFRRRLARDREIIELSGLFDGSFYRTHYPDVADDGQDPITHYIEHGWKEGRDPSLTFNTNAYLAAYPDVALANRNPLAHYIEHGLREGRPVTEGSLALASGSVYTAMNVIRQSRLFDPAFYLASNPDVAAAGLDALAHYLQSGASEGRDPSPTFATTYYLQNNPDVAAEGVNPLYHYIISGRAEGRQPHPASEGETAAAATSVVIPDSLPAAMDKIQQSGLFDPIFYSAKNPDVVAAGLDPLFHFAAAGGLEGRDPHPLFNISYYRDRYPDAVSPGCNPLIEYIDHGGRAGRNPHPDFDGAYYLSRYPDVAAAGLNPLIHYLHGGAHEGRDPSPNLLTNYYLKTNPDVARAGLNPLAHYVTAGRAEGRHPHPAASKDKAVSGSTPIERLIGRFEEAGAVGAAVLLNLSAQGLHGIKNAFLPYSPVNAVIDSHSNSHPTLRILCPSLQMRHATGGPNTIFIVGCALAARGVRVSFVSTDVPLEQDVRPIKAHMARLSGVDPDTAGVTLLDASDRNRPISIGFGDVIMATAWWTAQMARDLAMLTRNSSIFYLIQDYETLFYGASESFSLAEETYFFDHIPIINTSLLRDHLISQSVGRFANPEFGEQAFVFEPAVDAQAFRPVTPEADAPRRLLFYARPETARRNLFYLGVAALRAAVDAGLFRGTWEFLGMGDRFAPIPLGRGYELKPAPWLDFVGYAKQMATSDVVLSLMLSPHPSYPPLEAAACGIHAVTSEFSVKSGERLGRLSPNIIGVQPRIDALVTGLMRAVSAADANRNSQRANRLNMPSTWTESLAPILPNIVRLLRDRGCIRSSQPPVLPPPVTTVRTYPDTPDSPVFYSERLFSRAREYREGSTSCLLSLITTVYDTKPSFLIDLARTIYGQDTTLRFEWLILDNGSSDPETLACLVQIAQHPFVRLERVERNLGIVGGMRWCLENARNRYVLPLDSDDLLFPDCMRTITAFLEQTGFPKAVYTNEDKTNGTHHLHPYIKPDWDPVLFIHSCYVAHLTIIDRAVAMEIGCYSAPEAEGCHDWDTFSRLLISGFNPVHLPEILYSWRTHPGSTSDNHASKPYIRASHRFVLERFLVARSMAESHKVVDAPLFGGTADYRFARRSKMELKQIPEFVLRARVSTQDLIQFCKALPEEAGFVRLRSLECVDVADLCDDEALTLIQAFPDTVMVGGRIHDGTRIVESGYVFGYQGLIGCPDVGRALSDPGYFAQAWKPRTVAAVSARLAVVRRDVLIDALQRCPVELDAAVLGIWLGFAARDRGGRVVFSPYLAAWTDAPPLVLRATEAADIAERFGRHDRDRVGYAPNLDLTGYLPYSPSALRSLPHDLPAYVDYQSDRADRRSTSIAIPHHDAAATVSILTTVYIRTDVALFEETAASILDQTQAVHEWVVLAHGPISPQLDAVLVRLGEDPRLKIFRLGRNLGIHGGLRYCLEHATGDFVASVDADDLLTPDAVATILAAAVLGTEILYSDEDLLIDGKPAAPLYRPAYDPILLRAHSTIWHLIVFRREIGLSLGVFTAGDAQYAQDWDTILRFEAAGHVPVHVPHVLYHWRQHASSISNSGSAFEGSGRSVKAILEGLGRRSTKPELLSVQLYPVDLGSQTLYLERAHRDAPRLSLVRFKDALAPLGRFPFAEVVSASPERGHTGVQRLTETIEGLQTELVLLCGQAIFDLDEHGLWQAVKHFELVPQCVAVGGALIDRGGRILAAPAVQSGGGELIDPLVGFTVSDSGPFSLALLPHRVSTVPIDLALIRRPFLRDAMRAAPATLGLRSLGAWLGEFAWQNDRVVAYEPLLRGVTNRRLDLIGDDVEGLCRSVRVQGWFNTGAETPVRGMAGFVANCAVHGL